LKFSAPFSPVSPAISSNVAVLVAVSAVSQAASIGCDAPT